jgi:hypothetical protein
MLVGFNENSIAGSKPQREPSKGAAHHAKDRARPFRKQFDSQGVIRVYDEAGNVIETYEHTGDFREW